jgi:type I restriction enzyme M protein
MITPALRASLDEKWEDCWPVSTLRPLALLDLLSYVFFIKKLDDKELLNKKLPDDDLKDFNWSSFRNMNAQQIHDLFTRQHGIIDSMIQYGNSGSLYSYFFKTPPLLAPTPRLLCNVIQIINVIETSEKNTQAVIIEYLVNKADIVTQNGQVYLPENIEWLMVCAADPTSKDIILDPSAGNGGLLVNAAGYIAKNNSFSSEYIDELETKKLKGMESDLIQLRIAGLNMVLHGIKNPNLQALNASPDNSLRSTEKPTLLISNLFFTDVESSLPSEANLNETGRKDIFFLNIILKNLEPGGRAVVLVPEFFLFSNDPAIINIRREIVDHNKLEGVISLPTKSNSLLSRAGILIFNKHESITTETVWFFRMKKGEEKAAGDEQNSNNGVHAQSRDNSEPDEVNEILHQWKNRKAGAANNPGDSYYITAYDIAGNNYILNFDDYKTIAKKREINKKAEKRNADKRNTIVNTTNEYPDNNFEEGFPSEQKRSKRKILSAVIVFLLLVIVVIGIYFYNFKNPGSSFANSGDGADSISNSNRDTSSSKILSDSPTINRNLSSSPPDLSKGYSVIDKAYFYRGPNVDTRRTLYLLHRNDYVLHPTAEQNGFVYIVYVNKSGETTKGWINKKDLQPVH